ncbi:hypothetical protein A4R89_14830 (plasmid) [Acetobacter ascendens]|nr:hypothetical protein A4R89_14830 [Acetobacter ascendens]
MSLDWTSLTVWFVRSLSHIIRINIFQLHQLFMQKKVREFSPIASMLMLSVDRGVLITQHSLFQMTGEW